MQNADPVTPSNGCRQQFHGVRRSRRTLLSGTDGNTLPDAETREIALDAVKGTHNSDNLGTPTEQSRDFDFPMIG